METNFGKNTAYGKTLDEELKKYQQSLDTFSSDQEDNKTALGEEQSVLIKSKNKSQKDKLAQYSNKIDGIESDYNKSLGDRRKQADDLLKNQKDTAGFEANIAAAKANQGGRLSVGQLSTISKDITNQFSQSLNSAAKDNINFNADLDSKLKNMGLTSIDKQRVLDEFGKVLTDEETAPLLDAIASKYNTRGSFMKSLSDTIKGLHQSLIKDASGKAFRSNRLANDETAFNAMSKEERAREIRDRFGPTWNVLTPSQKQEMINKTVSGTQSYSETLDMIKNLKDKAEQNKIERQQMLASGQDEDLTNSIYAEGGIDSYSSSPLNTTSDGNNYTGKDFETQNEKQNRIDKEETTRNKKIAEIKTKAKADRRQKLIDDARRKNKDTTVSNIGNNKSNVNGYKVGKITYTSKKDYNLLKSRTKYLANLRRTNPDKFNKVWKLIKKKYIIN